MNYRRILIAAVLILYIQWKKTVKNVTSWRHKTLSASAIRKQVSRCCIHFPHELSCQILTNQSIKIKRRVWPTRDHGEKSQKRLPSLHQFSCRRSVWNQNFNGAVHEHNLFHMHLKNIELEPAIIWKVVTCQRIISKKYSNSVGRYLSARYGQAILVSGCTVLTAVNWSQHGWSHGRTISGCRLISVRLVVRKCQIVYLSPRY